MDPLATETSEFWRNAGEYNDVDTASIQTTVFRLPTTCFRRGGRLAGEQRPLAAMALEGRRAAAVPRRPTVIMGGLFHRLRELYSRKAVPMPNRC